MRSRFLSFFGDNGKVSTLHLQMEIPLPPQHLLQIANKRFFDDNVDLQAKFI